MGIWAEYRDFFREFRRDFHHTGAVLPSGPFLARALARPLRGPRPAARVLEVGPGTGAVTREIARRMGPDDFLDLVEINPTFAQRLEQMIALNPLFEPHRARSRVILAPVQEVLGDGAYDFIISGLPLNNFSPAEVRSVFAAFRRLLRPGGLLCYFEYALVRQLKAPFVNRRERRRLYRVGRIVGRQVEASQVERERVLINVPPAVVRRLRLRPAETSPVAEG